ncbi:MULTISPECIES: hypothetical protein [unclassified Chelatococcus]|uniref:hypothetical protein n=1 Tax=unclassified Chelatococcus TaxID=2638111 RepID=UPI001BCE9003|nr:MULTISPECIES: hypothetical protein [unclassified Chelatococcus]CAH1656410.1 conserved hypothetical protein [Hyphomicrobiales bacterium]MBS7742458.1 hypothetical protein [Chelatococcus sp. HY11]MBX3542424.1 hypothetical protein [Chelatococcus sp.]MCO5075359.1 hypothetical protein [Chelatococcus sp.]CAH1695839.1 conserved hypothetical protein [Hyphomicrobiales bacterium]
MSEKLITANLAATIATRALPGITQWNRLEGRPRTENFERALRAEIRDPLWLLTRQWQMGEFRGDDAGSPIFARARIETTRLTGYRAADGPAEAFDTSLPLEARVEPLPVALSLGDHDIALDIRLMLGRYWLKLIKALPQAARDQYIAAYPIHAPDPNDAADAPTLAHADAWAQFAAVAGRAMDGAKLYAYLKADPAHRASDGIAALAGGEAQADAHGVHFLAWFEKLLHQPAEGSAFIPERLEYQFSCATPAADGAEKVYVADQYFQGHLDWYNFDSDPTRTMLGEATTVGGEATAGGEPPQAAVEPPEVTTLTTLPAQATFNGMPNTRWWAFEDGRTNFGDIKPDTTDLAKLLLIEFGLIYANDWFVVPFIVPAGAIATIKGLAVTNVFGERIWIEAAGRGNDDNWQRWALFLTSVKGQGHQEADLSLMIPPAAQKTLEAAPLEEVVFVRDEMANMVWGLEQTVPLPTGMPKPGASAARETRLFFEKDVERRLGAPPQPPPAASGAKIRYKVMSTVPENWIPMIPVHVPGDNREVQLQRAAMLRVIEGDPAPPASVRPRSSLLRHGLDETPPQPYFLHEEEVSRAGVRVTKSFQRTRWRDGRVWLWLGLRKQTGRGGGSSGLSFDRIVDLA